MEFDMFKCRNKEMIHSFKIKSGLIKDIEKTKRDIEMKRISVYTSSMNRVMNSSLNSYSGYPSSSRFYSSSASNTIENSDQALDKTIAEYQTEFDGLKLELKTKQVLLESIILDQMKQVNFSELTIKVLEKYVDELFDQLEELKNKYKKKGGDDSDDELLKDNDSNINFDSSKKPLLKSDSKNDSYLKRFLKSMK